MAVYDQPYDKVWGNIVDTLVSMNERMAVIQKESGVIRTEKKNLNDSTWVDKGLGKATFIYELNIRVKDTDDGILVRTDVPFWEEKVFIASKRKSIPEGTNMMRHLFFKKLNEVGTPKKVILSEMIPTKKNELNDSSEDVSNQEEEVN